MSLVDEVLEKHVICKGTNCGWAATHCEAHGETITFWPCDLVRLATELQAAQQLIQAAGAVRDSWYFGDAKEMTRVAGILAMAYDRYDEGRTQ